MKNYKFTNQDRDTLEALFNTSFKSGLTASQVKDRQEKYGTNTLENAAVYWPKILLHQFTSPFIYLLIFSAVVSFFLKDHINTVIICIILLINSILSFIQEYRAEKALRLIRSHLTITAHVLREGHLLSVDSKELVPGDIVFLKAGDYIPADVRFLEAQGLTTNESTLTGESASVKKQAEPLSHEAHTIYEATNRGFLGTSVVNGSATALVTATGAYTEFGSISHLALVTEKQSGFQKRIASLSSFIVKLIIITLIAVVLVHVFFKPGTVTLVQLLLFALGLAISVTPEALPIVTTVALSQGALILARHNVVIKRLSALEDLGNITLLCTDKTGTLTENKLSIKQFYTISQENSFLYGLLASNPESKYQKLDPFDQAFWEYALPEDKKLVTHYKRIGEIPFDPQRKRNTVLVEYNNKYILISRGAYEELAQLSTNVTSQQSAAIKQWIAEQAATGCRVIAVAVKDILTHKTNIHETLAHRERDMTLVGLIALQDPIKPTARKAILQARELNVAVKMLTGDSKEVACAVAQQVELVSSATNCAITGSEFDLLTLAQKQGAVKKYAVFARVSPEQKYEIVTLLKAYNTVGFLGEGINDAPALKAAHVSLVVQGSSDIAQDVADIVLLQKSLYSIIEGIHIGRKVFANTIKYIKITLSSNFGNFYSVAFASLLVDFLPMLPIQILLVNLLADLPMISIATDSVDPEELKHTFVYSIKGLAFSASLFGIISSLFDFIFFGLFYKLGPSVVQTNWFIFSVLTELAIIYSLRTKKLFYKASKPSSTILILSCIAACLTLIAPFSHFGQIIFKFNPPTQSHIGIILVLVLGYFIVNELVKVFYYTSTSANQTTI